MVKKLKQTYAKRTLYHGVQSGQFSFDSAALLIVLYPMYFIVIASFSNSNMVNQGLVKTPHLTAFQGGNFRYSPVLCGWALERLLYGPALSQ